MKPNPRNSVWVSLFLAALVVPAWNVVAQPPTDEGSAGPEEGTIESSEIETISPTQPGVPPTEGAEGETPDDGQTTEVETFGGGGAPAEKGPAAPAPAGATTTSRAPDEYSIQSGDTLWDICGKFLDNPWYWPKLWSLNQYITNPHLIYPGDRLSFYGGSETAPPRLDIMDQGERGPAAVGETPPMTEAKETPAAAKAAVPPPAEVKEAVVAIKLKSLMFISKEHMDEAGKITHSGDEKMNLMEGDRVYIEYAKKSKPSVGDRLQVFREERKVREPGSSVGGTLGYLVRRTGVLKVIALHKRTVEAVIANAEDTIERNDRFVPFENPVRTVIPHTTSKELSAKIAATELDMFLIGGNDFVMLNRGKKHGLDDGLQLLVVRSGDGVFPGDDKNLPDVIVGRLLVVEANDETSTAYVTDLRKELAVGDRVRSRLE